MQSLQPEKKYLDVVCGLVFLGGKVLVCQKATGPRAGLWEFPGGKVHSGESPLNALIRELNEELQLEVLKAEESGFLIHDYDDISIRLSAWTVTGFSGEPKALEHKALEWTCREKLNQMQLCEADRFLAKKLGLLRRQ